MLLRQPRAPQDTGTPQHARQPACSGEKQRALIITCAHGRPHSTLPATNFKPAIHQLPFGASCDVPSGPAHARPVRASLSPLTHPQLRPAPCPVQTPHSSPSPSPSPNAFRPSLHRRLQATPFLIAHTPRDKDKDTPIPWYVRLASGQATKPSAACRDSIHEPLSSRPPYRIQDPVLPRTILLLVCCRRLRPISPASKIAVVAARHFQIVLHHGPYHRNPPAFPLAETRAFRATHQQFKLAITPTQLWIPQHLSHTCNPRTDASAFLCECKQHKGSHVGLHEAP